MPLIIKGNHDIMTIVAKKKPLIGGKGRAKPRNKKANDYINNKKFLEALVDYGKQCRKAKREKREEPRASNYIGECILLICNRLSLNRNFIGYPYRDEMISDGIEKATIAIPKFDPKNYSNPFAYFTQIAFNAFIARINREKKEGAIKHRNFINSYVLDSDYVNNADPVNDAVNDFLQKFDDSIAKKKKKAAIKKKKGVEKFIEERAT
jgi:hypothetical protein